MPPVADHYATLGVQREASLGEIQKAYRSAARQLHPDRNPDGEGEFKAVSNAYAVLGDKHQKAFYDIKLEAGEWRAGEAKRKAAAAAAAASQPPPAPSDSHAKGSAAAYARFAEFQRTHQPAQPPPPRQTPPEGAWGGADPPLSQAQFRTARDEAHAHIKQHLPGAAAPPPAQRKRTDSAIAGMLASTKVKLYAALARRVGSEEPQSPPTATATATPRGGGGGGGDGTPSASSEGDGTRVEGSPPKAPTRTQQLVEELEKSLSEVAEAGTAAQAAPVPAPVEAAWERRRVADAKTELLLAELARQKEEVDAAHRSLQAMKKHRQEEEISRLRQLTQAELDLAEESRAARATLRPGDPAGPMVIPSEQQIRHGATAAELLAMADGLSERLALVRQVYMAKTAGGRSGVP
eukprot:TRINITY_DN9291_c2_g1_i1.p1 TRINITY_DN9291_c2_g1~~TRINITY_DN9291_c2_g1_i1.p1  ORF type:complete len:438 (+),score=171.58 TRINITY_DN9291_c2_g1_i1:92-1315(+)